MEARHIIFLMHVSGVLWDLRPPLALLPLCIFIGFLFSKYEKVFKSTTSQSSFRESTRVKGYGVYGDLFWRGILNNEKIAKR